MYKVNKFTLNTHFIILIRRASDNTSMKRALWFSQLVQYDIQTEIKPLATKLIQKRPHEDNTSNVELFTVTAAKFSHGVTEQVHFHVLQ